MRLEALLQSVPPDQWSVQDVIAFDWYDGPREGVCALAHPQVEFFFALLDERINVNDVDDRLFRLSELPQGSVAGLRSVWQFTTEEDRRQALQAARDLVSAGRPTSLVIRAQEFGQVRGCWNVDRAEQDRKDWFAYLGITPGAIPTEDSPNSLPAAK